MMTKQETFDFVVQHLYRQGRPADDGYYCAYRTKDGLKCAAGCLIPDDMYSRRLEMRTVHQLILEGHTVPEEFSKHYHMVKELQSIHDCWDSNHPFESIVSRLSEAAIDHNVVFTHPAAEG